MVGYSRCAVPFCHHTQTKNRGCIYASFPKDIDRCRTWVRNVGVEDLVHLPIERLNRLRFVCGCHFEEEHFSSVKRNRLKRTAIPTVMDARVVPLKDELMSLFPLQYDYVPVLKSAAPVRQRAGHNVDVPRRVVKVNVKILPRPPTIDVLPDSTIIGPVAERLESEKTLVALYIDQVEEVPTIDRSDVASPRANSVRNPSIFSINIQSSNEKNRSRLSIPT